MYRVLVLLQQVWDYSLGFATNTQVEHAVPSNDSGWVWYVARKARKDAKT